jgi:hypothetical protein
MYPIIYIYTYIHPIISRYISVLKGLLPPLLMANHPWFSHFCCKDPMKSKTRLGRARKVLELASQNAEWALGQEEEVQVRGKTYYEPKVKWVFGCWEVCGFCMAKTHTHISIYRQTYIWVYIWFIYIYISNIHIYVCIHVYMYISIYV